MNQKFWDIRSPKPQIKPLPPLRRRKRKWLIIILTLAAAAGLLTFGLLNFINGAKNAAAFIYKNFKEGAYQMFNLELEKARSSFESVSQKITDLQNRLDGYSLLNFGDLKAAFSHLTNLNQHALSLSQNLALLKNHGFNWLMNQKGDRLIENLTNIADDLKNMSQSTAELKNITAKSGISVGNDYLSLSVDLQNAQNFLTALIDWLKSPTNQYLAILFQNPSELRPAGGFIGSYGVLTFRQGNLTNIEVRDIYDPDGQLVENIIPPKPLQLITARWGARDANWFFDFPTSAKKVIDFLAKSKLHQEQFITFSGALAINVGVIEDLISITGPIELPDYRLTLNQKNFLSEIQKEVETGKDKKSGQPKKILKVLTPMLFEKIAGLNDEQKRDLALKLSDRVRNKDIMIYFNDLAIESYLKTLGVAGEIQNLPHNFSGGYLAVVNANIGGHKTDAFVKQSIDLKTVIDAEGAVTNRLTIMRSHNGQRQTEWWYKAANKIYMQIFLPAGTQLTAVEGQEWKTVKAPLNYAVKNYLADPDVAAIENTRRWLDEFSLETFQAFGKTVYAAWLTVPAGESKTIALEYQNPSKLTLQDGQPYEFIFEKQSGATTNLKISIKAPPGYYWRESNSADFTYETPNPERRLHLKLILIKL